MAKIVETSSLAKPVTWPNFNWTYVSLEDQTEGEKKKGRLSVSVDVCGCRFQSAIYCERFDTRFKRCANQYCYINNGSNYLMGPSEYPHLQHFPVAKCLLVWWISSNCYSSQIPVKTTTVWRWIRAWLMRPGFGLHKYNTVHGSELVGSINFFQQTGRINHTVLWLQSCGRKTHLRVIQLIKQLN